MIRIVDLTAPTGTETVLQFVLENRPPVLNQIDPYGPYPAVVAEGCQQFDLIAIENQLLTLEPLAFDTDEDELTYSYSGWLEEYNETVGNEVIDPISKCVKSYASSKITYDPEKPGQIRWIKDPDFENNGKASAFITTKDIGPHNMRITVCDKQNYCDYQDIRILIDDFIDVGIDGISIGTNDLTMLTLGTDRDNENVTKAYDEMNPAVLWSLKRLITSAAKRGVTSSICGQAPSIYPELVEELVKWGITSVSISPDRINTTRKLIYEAERKLVSR